MNILPFREELEKKYEGKLSKEMSGLEYELVSKLMKTLTGKKITVPGNYTRWVWLIFYSLLFSDLLQ